MESKKTAMNALKSFGLFVIFYLGYKLISPAFRMNDRPKMYIQKSLTKTDTSHVIAVNITNILQYDADSMNRNTSLFSDSTTTLRDVSVIPAKTIQFNYTLKLDPNKYNMPKVKRVLEKNLLDSIVNSSSFKVYRDSSVIVVFNFTDIKMNPLFKIKFTPDNYK
ncbi:MAG: hypothetical protein M3139_11425 [Bacteroidota bacterium]|nr:hypothetical protein [Bacteroidota bacterium]